MEKKQSHAFGKDVYLLGADEDGTYYWLEAPSWDCGHYWGFGYIETYTNNKFPSNSKDIDSHQHADDFYPKWWGQSDSTLKKTTFTESEGWDLAELFKRFYTLKSSAEMFARGGCHVSGTSDYLIDEELAKRINEELIPETTKKIIEILTP